jgi:WD40 repeat protein/tRNA A-37 threonylcarbamoyl transferase component Bud32
MRDDFPDGSQPDSRLESVLAEIEEAQQRGEVIDKQHYLDHFPDLTQPLHDYFCDREWFAGVVAPRLPPTDTHPGAPLPQPGLPPGSVFAGYEIIKELGRGGMGIVYHARQLSPEREVALKVIRTDRLAELPDDQQRQWLERFRREAQLVASLEQHPNLVTLYEVGEHEGRPFFTMQLVRGGTLAETVRGGRRAAGDKESARGAAQLVAAAARALDHVHKRGVLHRDLKPGNLLLNGNGQLLVSDFGLARRLDQSGSLVAGAIEGTAEYMAPEQARGLPGAVTTAADVYSLGAVLYALLTGRPPFKGASTFETLMLVTGQEPAPLRSLNPRVPRDLEVICLKCLEKEPGRRYVSAAALADDLENWLAGRPVLARPAGAAGRLWRWCRREPVLAGALGFAAVAIVAFALVAGAFAFYREQANRGLEKAASDLTDAFETVKTERNQAVTAKEKLSAEQRTTRQLTAGLALDRGRSAWEAGDPAQGLLWMARSLALAPDDDAALQEAIRIDLAGWRATIPPPRPPLRHPGIVAQAAFTPDGGRLIALSTGTVSREEKTMPDGKTDTVLVFHPETPGDDSLVNLHGPPPRRLATPRGQVLIWDVATGKPVDVKPPPDSQVLAVTPDGKIALTTKRQDQIGKPSVVQLWDVTRGEAVGESADLNLSIRWAACSGDGKTFATIGGGLLGSAGLMLWDAQTGRYTGFSLGVEGLSPPAASLSPDGRVLAVVTTSHSGGGPRVPRPGMTKPAPPGEIELYDLATRKRLPALPGVGPWGQEIDSKAAVAVGPGGRLVLMVSASNDLRAASVRLWDREANKQLSLPYQGRLAFARFSPDGKALLTASGRGLADVSEAVQLWDTVTGQPRGAPLLPRGAVQAAAFSSDSKLLAIGCGEGEVQLWETATGRPVARALRHPGPVHAVAFSPDGSKLVTGCRDGMARVWDTGLGTTIRPLHVIEGVAASGGHRCLQRGEGNTLRLLDLASGRPCGEPVPCAEKALIIALGPDERTVAIVPEGNKVRIWDAVTGQPVGEPLTTFAKVTGIRFSPDGRTLWTFAEYDPRFGATPIVQRWDAATGRSLGFEKDPHVSLAPALSPDSRRALRIHGGTAVVLEVSGVQGGAKSLKHHGPITGGLFSPDSRTLLTTAVRSGSWEEAQLWDLDTGKPLGPPMPHQGPIRAKVFSLDGKLVLTGSDDGTARVWDAATGKPLGPLMSHGDRVSAVALGPEGNLAATAGGDGTVRLWHVATGRPLGPPLPHPAAVSFVAFGTGGETLITAASDRVWVWSVPRAMPGEPQRLLLEAELETGMELGGSTTRLLEDAERAQRVRQLEGHTPVKPVEGEPLPR